jgi:transketolase
MRKTLIKTLVELAARDERLVFLTADLGYAVVEPFQEAFPKRFFNVGVAEQNMVGMATGLAEAGMIPFVYSIAPFAAIRPFEFIRNGPVLHGLPVRVCGVGGGFDYGAAGHTHHALEDIGMMRMQPGMTVVTPADNPQARHAVLATWDSPGPVYYRLAKDDKYTMSDFSGAWAPGQAQLAREGEDALIISLGSIAREADAAVAQLAEQGIKASLLVASCMKPEPAEFLASAIARHRSVVTVENHYVEGGLGEMTARIMAERGLMANLRICAVRRMPDGQCGPESFYHARHGIDAAAIARAVQSALQVLPV